MKVLRGLVGVCLAALIALSIVGASFLITTLKPVTQVGSLLYSQAAEVRLPQEKMGDTALSVWGFVMRGEPSELPEFVAGHDGFSREQVSHLVDVREVIAAARTAILIVFGLTIIFGVACWRLAPKRTSGTVLVVGGAIPLVTVAVIGVVAAVDFDSFFRAFHTLFFEDGTWTFTYNSMLIRLFPEGFWVYAGVVWLASALLLSVLVIVSGALMRRSKAVPKRNYG